MATLNKSQQQEFSELYARNAEFTDYSYIQENGHIAVKHNDILITISPRKTMGFSIALSNPAYIIQRSDLFDVTATRYARLNPEWVNKNLFHTVDYFGKSNIVFLHQSLGEVVDTIKDLIDIAANDKNRKLTDKELQTRNIKILQDMAEALGIAVTIITKN